VTFSSFSHEENEEKKKATREIEIQRERERERERERDAKKRSHERSHSRHFFCELLMETGRIERVYLGKRRLHDAPLLTYLR